MKKDIKVPQMIKLKEQKMEKIGSILYFLRRIIPAMFKIFPFFFGLSILVLLIQSAIPLVQIYIMTKLINTIEQLINGNEIFLMALLWLGIQAGINILSAAMLLCEELLQSKMSFKISFFYEKLVLEKTKRLSLLNYEKHESYDLLAQTNGAGERGIQIIMSLRVICMYSITITGYIVTLFHYSWLLPVLIVALAIPNILLNIRISEQRYGQMLLQSPNSRKATYITQLFKSRDSIKEIKLYQTEKYLLDKWISIYWKQANEKYGLQKKAGIMGFNFDSIGVVSILGATSMLIYISSIGKLSLGEYVALTMAIGASYGMIKSIASNFSKMYEESLFAKKLYLFLDLPEEGGNTNLKEFPHRLVAGIEVRNLSFSYPSQNKEILSNISFKIMPGEKISIVGYNGAGKSTLIKCLLGLYPVPNGTIFYDDTDINMFDPKSLRENITAIFQDFIRYNLTVRENVGFGKLTKMNNDALLDEATTKANVNLVVEELPGKYETELGHLFMGGQDLSGGQWQKIAISRAFLRDSQIVIFDEPTSALDPVAESQIFEQIMKMTEDKIAIFISHRLSSCRSADQIFVLKDGALVQNGTHQELLIEGGDYAEMFAKQSSGYLEVV